MFSFENSFIFILSFHFFHLLTDFRSNSSTTITTNAQSIRYNFGDIMDSSTEFDNEHFVANTFLTVLSDAVFERYLFFFSILSSFTSFFHSFCCLYFIIIIISYVI